MKNFSLTVMATLDEVRVAVRKDKKGQGHDLILYGNSIKCIFLTFLSSMTIHHGDQTLQSEKLVLRGIHHFSFCCSEDIDHGYS